MHGDPGDRIWFHPEDMADPAPPSLLYLLFRLSGVAQLGVRPQHVQDSA